MSLKSKIRTIPHWPKEGVMFRDLTTLFKDPKAFKLAVQTLAKHYESYAPPKKIEAICAIEARGFILGAAMAYEMGLPFIPIRKKGKLPAETFSQEYDLEYGRDKIEIHRDALKEGENVLLVDDLLATAGTAFGAAKLIEKAKAKLIEACFIVELPDLKGGEKLTSKNISWHALVQFQGE